MTISMINKFRLSILYLFIAILLIFVRLLRPFILIRFGKITSYILGHFIFDTEYYLSEMEINNQRSFDYFYYDYKYNTHKNPPNDQWDKMVRRHFKIHPFVSHFYRLNKIIPGGKSHIIKMAIENFKSRDLKGILNSTTPQFSFTEEENTNGEEFLNKIGIGSGEKFVCLNVRDSAYKEKYQNWKNNWSYHNHRNSDINTYEEAILALAEKGYWIFRMGKIVEKPLRIKHPLIYDYASMNCRNDFLDIWLMANCFFCISSLSGLDCVCDVFRVPLVYVNQIAPFQRLHSWNNSLTIPKKLIWMKTGEYLSLSELIKHGYSNYLDYEKNGISIIDCTPKEITEVVLEMHMRLNQTWIDNKKDQNIQNLFWEKFKVEKGFDKLHGKINPDARLGNSFLHDNNDWFFRN